LLIPLPELGKARLDPFGNLGSDLPLHGRRQLLSGKPHKVFDPGRPELAAGRSDGSYGDAWGPSGGTWHHDGSPARGFYLLDPATQLALSRARVT
jgi:hypothetical protein